ncbi:MAG: hypothetical protein VB024_12095 [Dysgonamonadaceae bacterium]|nr:hypothetical protein [Dysgonamonadaceae bacterium]
MKKEIEEIYILATMEHYLEEAHKITKDIDKVFDLIDLKPIDILLMTDEKLKYITSMLYTAKGSLPPNGGMKIVYKNDTYKIQLIN